MSDTPKLVMPEISESQASKYVTHNEALRDVDALLQCTVIDKDLSDAPGSPSDGDTYIVGPSPSSGDDWNGHSDEIAYYKSSAWDFHVPEEGWRCWVQDESEAYVYLGGSLGWQPESAAIVGDFTELGDAPASYTGHSLKAVRVNSAETAVEFVANQYDVGGSWSGKPPASQVILRLPMVRAIQFADDLTGSRGVVGTAPTGTATFSIKKNGSEVGTMAFAGAATTATFATAGGSVEAFAAGDVLTVVAPGTQDATLSDLGFILAGVVT